MYSSVAPFTEVVWAFWLENRHNTDDISDSEKSLTMEKNRFQIIISSERKKIGLNFDKSVLKCLYSNLAYCIYDSIRFSKITLVHTSLRLFQFRCLSQFRLALCFLSLRS